MATTELNIPVRISVLKESIADLQSQLSNLQVDSNSFKTLNRYIQSMTQEMTRFEALTSRSFNSQNQFNRANKSIEKMEDTLSKARIAMNDIKFPELKLSSSQQAEWDSFTKTLDQAMEKFDQVKNKVKGQILEDSDAQKLFEGMNPKYMEKSYDELFSMIDTKTQQLHRKLNTARDALTNERDKRSAQQARLDSLLSKGISAESIGKEAFNQFFEQVGNSIQFKNIPGRSSLKNEFIDELGEQFGLADKDVTELKNKFQNGSFKKLNSIITDSSKTMFREAFGSGKESALSRAVEDAEQSLNKYQNLLQKFQDASFTGDKNKLAGEVGEAFNELEAKIQKVNKAREEFQNNLVHGFQKGGLTQGLTQYQTELNNFKRILSETNQQFLKLEQTKRTFSNMKMAVQNFMGFYQILNLTKRAVKEAMTHIKDLDSVMNKISIVTNKSTSDLWNQVDAYSDMAQKYGVSIKGAYEVSQIYYQQGLQEADVLTLTNETLKLSKISGLDYATTTDYMTTAMRGFKMETEDAGRVVDVYSNLAAHTAVTQGELAVGMSKTASSLESVGASFEESSAMIATMVAVTRESSTNIGSAMKSIASRYGEMKKDMSAAFDAEGEALSYNKVDAALQSVGISLKDSSGQFRNMTDVIIELGEQWDTLDSVQQRYIATQFAGNRQQSRFLALVSNVDLLKSNLNYALDSENVGDIQALKALDSIESRTEQLKVAYQQMYTTIGAQDMWKGALSGLTNFMNTLNGLPKLFNTLPIGAASMLYDVVSVIKNVGSVAIEGVSKGILTGLLDDEQIQAKTQEFMNRVNQGLNDASNKNTEQTENVGKQTANKVTEGAEKAQEDKNQPAAKPKEIEQTIEPAAQKGADIVAETQAQVESAGKVTIPTELERPTNTTEIAETANEEMKDQKPAEMQAAVEQLAKDTTATINTNANIEGAAAAIDSLNGRTVTVNVVANGGTTSFGPGVALDGVTSAKGNAYAVGNRQTLVGELGPEMYVSNGKYQVVGATGPEMVSLPDDAIVFNHQQTRDLLKNQKTSNTGRPITNESKAIAKASGDIDFEILSQSIIESLKNMLSKILGSESDLVKGMAETFEKKITAPAIEKLSSKYDFTSEITQIKLLRSMLKEYGVDAARRERAKTAPKVPLEPELARARYLEAMGISSDTRGAHNQLNGLWSKKDKGILSQEEYEAESNKILAAYRLYYSPKDEKTHLTARDELDTTYMTEGKWRDIAWESMSYKEDKEDYDLYMYKGRKQARQELARAEETLKGRYNKYLIDEANARVKAIPDAASARQSQTSVDLTSKPPIVQPTIYDTLPQNVAQSGIPHVQMHNWGELIAATQDNAVSARAAQLKWFYGGTSGISQFRDMTDEQIQKAANQWYNNPEQIAIEIGALKQLRQEAQELQSATEKTAIAQENTAAAAKDTASSTRETIESTKETVNTDRATQLQELLALRSKARETGAKEDKAARDALASELGIKNGTNDRYIQQEIDALKAKSEATKEAAASQQELNKTEEQGNKAETAQIHQNVTEAVQQQAAATEQLTESKEQQTKDAFNAIRNSPYSVSDPRGTRSGVFMPTDRTGYQINNMPQPIRRNGQPISDEEGRHALDDWNKFKQEGGTETESTFEHEMKLAEEAAKKTVPELGASLGEVFNLASGEALDTSGMDQLLGSLEEIGTITEQQKSNLSELFATGSTEEFLDAYSKFTEAQTTMADANKNEPIETNWDQFNNAAATQIGMDLDNLGQTIDIPIQVDAEQGQESVDEFIEQAEGQIVMPDVLTPAIDWHDAEQSTDQMINNTESKFNNLGEKISQALTYKGNRGLGSQLSQWGSGINMLSGLIQGNDQTSQTLKGSIMTGSGVMKMIGGYMSGSPMAMMTGLMNFVNGISTIIEDDAEKLKRLSAVAEELDTKAKQEKANYKTLDNSIKKINELEETRYDSEEAAEEYQKTVDDLTEKFPELISGFDEFGNALVDMSVAEDALAAARSKSVNATYEALEAEETRLEQERHNTINTAQATLDKVPQLFESVFNQFAVKGGQTFKEKLTSADNVGFSSGMQALDASLSPYAWGENTSTEANMLKSIAWYADQGNIGILADDSANVIATKKVLQKIRASKRAIQKDAEGNITGLDINETLNAIADLKSVEAEQLRSALSQEQEKILSLTPEMLAEKTKALSDAIDSQNIDLINQTYEELSPLIEIINGLTISEDDPLFTSIKALNEQYGKVSSLIQEQRALNATQISNAKGLVNAYITTQHLTDDFIQDESGLLTVLSNNFADAYIDAYKKAVNDGKTLSWSDFKTANVASMEEAANAMNNFWMDLVVNGEETSEKFTTMIKNLENYRKSDFEQFSAVGDTWDDVDDQIYQQITKRANTIRNNLSKYFSTHATQTSGLQESEFYSQWVAAAKKVETYSEGQYLKNILSQQTSLYEDGFVSDADIFGSAALDVYNRILTLQDPDVRNALWKSIDKNKVKTKEGIDKIIKDIENSETTADDILIPMLQNMRDLIQDSIGLALESIKNDFIENWDDGSKTLKSLTSGIDLKTVDSLLTSNAGKSIGLALSDFTTNGDNLVLKEEDAQQYINAYFEQMRNTLSERSTQLQEIGKSFGEFDENGQFNIGEGTKLKAGYKLTEQDLKDFNALLGKDEYKKYINSDGTLKGGDSLSALYTALSERYKAANESLDGLGLYLDAATATVQKSYEWSKGDYSSLKEIFSKENVSNYESRLKQLAGGAKWTDLELNEPDIKNAVDQMTSGYSGFLSDILEKGTDNIRAKQYKGILSSDVDNITRQLAGDMDVSDFIAQYYQAAGWTLEEANSKIIENNRKNRESYYDEIKEIANISKPGQQLDLTKTTQQISKQYNKLVKAKRQQLNYVKREHQFGEENFETTKAELEELERNNPLEQFASRLQQAGAILENGILTLLEDADLTKIASILSEMASSLGSDMNAELSDLVSDMWKSYTDSITKGIEGGMTSVEADQLTKRAREYGVNLSAPGSFVQTGTGLQLSQATAIDLYTSLSGANGLLGKQVYQSLTKSLKENNKQYKTAHSLLAHIGELQRKIADLTEDTTEEHKKLKKQLENERDLAKSMALDTFGNADSSWGFGNGDHMAGSMSNMIDYYSTWGSYMGQITQWSTNKKVDPSSFIELAAHVSEMAQSIGKDINFLGQTFDKNGKIGGMSLVDLQSQLFTALQVDNKGNAYYDLSDLSKLGFNITNGKAAMSGMYGYIDEYLQPSFIAADAWNEFVDSLDNVQAAMEKSNRTIDSFFNEDGSLLNLKDFNDFIEKNNLGETWNKFADNFSIGHRKLSDILKDKSWGNNAKKYSKAVKGILQMVMDTENWDNENRLQSISEMMTRYGIEGDYTIDGVTIHAEGGTTITQDEGSTTWVDNKGNTYTGTPNEVVNAINKKAALDIQNAAKKYQSSAYHETETGYTLTLSEDGYTVEVIYNQDGSVSIKGPNGEPLDSNLETVLNNAYTEFGKGVEKSDWFQSLELELTSDETALSIFNAFTGKSGEIIGKQMATSIAQGLTTLATEAEKNGEPLKLPVEIELQDNLESIQNKLPEGVKLKVELDIDNPEEKTKPKTSTKGQTPTGTPGGTNKINKKTETDTTNLPEALGYTASAGVSDTRTRKATGIADFIPPEQENAAQEFTTKQLIQQEVIPDKAASEQPETLTQEIQQEVKEIETPEIQEENVNVNYKIGTVEELPLQEGSGIINYGIGTIDIPRGITATGTINYKRGIVEGPGEAKGGIGLLKGNAHAKSTLMGELGPELVVSNNRYFVVGQNGPEFVDLADDAIVFNHLQTKSLLEKGTSSTRGRAVTNERNAVAYAHGNITGGPAKESRSKIATPPTNARDNLSSSILSGALGSAVEEISEAFIKTLDIWYNYLQEIAKLEKQLSYEEALRSKLQSDFNKDGQAYYDSQTRSLQQMTKTIAVNQELITKQTEYQQKRYQEMVSAGNPFTSFYELDEDNQLRYKAGAEDRFNAIFSASKLTNAPYETLQEQYNWLINNGFGSYMEYDKEGKKIEIGGENDKNGSGMKSAIQAFIDKMEADKEEMQSLTDSIADAKVDILEQQQAQNEILKEIEDNQIAVEEKVYDAIVDMRERMINELKDQKEAIQQSNERLINGLSKQLSQEREMYETNQSENDLAKLQRQLAILQRSGGSAAAINELQAQIDNKTKDLYFTKQQEQIDAIQNASDIQIEKLEEQISLEEETLEYQKNNGLLWEQVHQLMTAEDPQHIAAFITEHDSKYWGESPLQLMQDSRDILFEAQQYVAQREDTSGILSNTKAILDALTKESESDSGNEQSESDSGNEQSGTWVQDENGWWYKHDDGTWTSNDWEKIDGKWYYFNDQGYMHTGWHQEGNDWYYLRDQGTMHTGWHQEGNDWYYFGSDGKMVTGTQTIDGVEYNFGSDGKLASSGTSGNTTTNKADTNKDGIVQYGEYANDYYKKQAAKKTAHGGYVGHGIYELGELGTETVFTAAQTKILRDNILSNRPNSLLSLLKSYNEGYGHISDNVSKIENFTDNSTTIEYAEVKVMVDHLNDSYDAARAGDDIMKEMVNIARKTQINNRIWR